MSYAIIILPTAERRIEEAHAYYEERSFGAAENFMAELNDTFSWILRYPETPAFFRRGVRRLKMRTYPYNVLYRLKGNEVLVLNLFHVKRNPQNWRT